RPRRATGLEQFGKDAGSWRAISSRRGGGSQRRSARNRRRLVHLHPYLAKRHHRYERLHCRGSGPDRFPGRVARSRRPSGPGATPRSRIPPPSNGMGVAKAMITSATHVLKFGPWRFSGAWCLAIGAFLQLSAYSQQPSPAPSSLEDLQHRISEIITQPRYQSAMWGVKIISLDTQKTLFENNAEKLFSPASNSKLYTMALALDRLGPDYRIRTSLYARQRPNRWGTIKGDLIVYGRGDPTINAKLHGDIFQALEPLVAALTN